MFGLYKVEVEYDELDDHNGERHRTSFEVSGIRSGKKLMKMLPPSLNPEIKLSINLFLLGEVNFSIQKIPIDEK